MNLEQLILDADPVADVTIPGHDSSLARQSFDSALERQPGRKPTRKRSFVVPSFAAAVAAAAGVTLFLTVTPGVPAAANAATVLNQAADAAASQQPVVLHPGQYLYTLTRSLSNGFDEVNGKVFVPEYVYADQSWLTSQAAGKDVWTVVSPVTFFDGTRRLWIEAGRPKIYMHSRVVSWPTPPQLEPRCSVKVWRPGSAKPQCAANHLYSHAPLANLSHLPTDPAALARAIEHKTTGLESVNADETPSTPSAVFYEAMNILSLQSYGGTPALRSALFRVMAMQPGIKSLGPVKTRSGRLGVGLQTALEHNDLLKVIVDPATGQILESDDYDVHAVAEQWTEYLSTGVVNKIGQLPPN